GFSLNQNRCLSWSDQTHLVDDIPKASAAAYDVGEVMHVYLPRICIDCLNHSLIPYPSAKEDKHCANANAKHVPRRLEFLIFEEELTSLGRSTVSSRFESVANRAHICVNRGSHAPRTSFPG